MMARMVKVGVVWVIGWQKETGSNTLSLAALPCRPSHHDHDDHDDGDHYDRGHDSIHDDMNMSAMITWSRGVHSHDPKYHTMNNSSS